MNRKMYLALQNALFMLSAVILFSCQSDYSTAPDKKITVTGTVKTFLQFNVPNITVKIGDKSAITNSEGKFVISDVTTPYDIYFSDSSVSGSTINRNGFIYKNLAIGNPLLIYGSNSNTLTGNINVIFSNGIAANKKAATFFSNYSDINAHGMNLPSQDSISEMSVFLHENKPVKGRLIALIYTVNSSQEIVSYDNFGFKDEIEISPGGNNNIIFTPDELTYNPQEAEISGSISGNLPPNAYLELTHFYLSFSGISPVTFLNRMALCFFENSSFSVKVPANLPILYYTLIGTRIVDGTNFLGSGNFLVPNYNQTGLQLNLLQQAELISPPDNSTNFNPKNALQWSQPQNGKVFTLNIVNISGNETISYYIYTSDLNFTLDEISKFNFQSPYGKTFSWSVDAIGGYSSINDYVYPYYNNILRSSMKMITGRTFTTQVSH